MTNPIFTHEITVNLMEVQASDVSVMAAARVSTKGQIAAQDWGTEASEGLIKFLMENRHGTPFEHNSFEFFVHAPIFVFREFHRHRIGWSYNEESGRYKVLEPKFYIPGQNRPGMMQTPGGRPGQYDYTDAMRHQWDMIKFSLRDACTQSYRIYEGLIENGVAKEVARMCLPVNIYSSMYVRCNARSLMAFLSLRQKRTKREPIVGPEPGGPLHGTAIDWVGEASFPSKPVHEINTVANAMEATFKEAMPITHAAWVKFGYVAP